LSITDEERVRLLSMTRARSLPAALRQRARIVLACEREPGNEAAAVDLGVGAHTVGKWRNRFITHRLAGLYDELRSGRPRTIMARKLEACFS
jgi:putative transposase